MHFISLLFRSASSLLFRSASSLGTASMASDRLSALPDNILSSYILSKLSLRDATRCTVLSTRWRYLCTLMPHLKFSNECVAGDGETTKQAIDTVLFFHSAQLESFELSFFMNDMEKGKITKCLQKWVQSASLKRVKQIALANVLTGSFLDVPTSLFSCECLTVLKLHLLSFKRLPPYFRGFRCLVTCSLSFIYTNDDILDHLVAKCPLLENLTVEYCEGLSNVKIFAGNLKCLAITGVQGKISVTVNCPNLVNFIVQHCPTMSMVELKSCGSLHLSTTELNLLKCFSTAKYVKKVSLHGLSRQAPSLALLENLVSLEELSIESKWFKSHAAKLEASNLSFSLKSLKKAHVKVSTFDEKEIALLGCLFRSAPLLQRMTLTLPRCSQYTHGQSFLKELLALKRRGEASVYIAEKHEDYCLRCRMP